MKMKGLSEPQTNAPPLTTTTNRTTNLPTTYAQTCTHRHKHAHTCRQTVGLCKQNLRMENPSSNLSNFASDEANNALGRDFVNLCSARKLKLYPKLTTCTCVYIPVCVQFPTDRRKSSANIFPINKNKSQFNENWLKGTSWLLFIAALKPIASKPNETWL